MINALKLVRFPWIKLYLPRMMLKYKNILHFSKEKVMVLIKAFLNIIQRVIPGDIHASKHLNAQY